MFRSSPRRGITRIEVFAVIVGVGLLLALVLPAIQTSREADRRMECGNQLETIALALQKYHDIHAMFPMGAMHSGPNPGGAPPVTARLGPSWWFGLLPLMDQRGGPKVVVSYGRSREGMVFLIDIDEPMYDKILESQRPGQDVDTPSGWQVCEFCAEDVDRYLDAQPYTVSDGQHVGELRLAAMQPQYMHCPNSPAPFSEKSIGPISLPSYVGIAGGCDIDPKSQDYAANNAAASGLVAPKAERVYHNRHKGTGAAAGGIVTSSGLLPPCQHVNLQKCPDGASNTMIVAEQSDWLWDRDPARTTKYHGDPGWSANGTGRGGGWLSGTKRVDPVPPATMPGGPPATWGADCWNITTVRYRPNFKRVMVFQPKDGGLKDDVPLPGCSDDHGINNPLQSPHPGGLQAAMADGSVQFIQQTVALEILLQKAIRDDGVPPPSP